MLATTFLAGIHFPLLLPNKPVCSVRWEGDVDGALLAKVRLDIAAAEDCTVLRVDLNTSGGSVPVGIEIIREMEKAQNEDLIIEMHGGAVVASMGTFIMAAGSPGHRTAYRHAFVVVHGIQEQGGACYYPTVPPTTEQEKVGAVLVENLTQLLVRHTGQPASVVRTWFQCDNAQYGDGWLLLKLGMADKVE
jgi:ATP-dependent Clp protease protease subunit